MEIQQIEINKNSRCSISSKSIEQSKGHQSFTSSNTVSQIINTDSIMKVFVSNKEDLNAKNECDWTPLYRTVIGGNNKATEQLLQMGADPNIQCYMGETALFQAVEMDKLSQIQTLLRHGADPNLSKNDGLTPLHSAVLKQNISMVEQLLKHGSNPNIKSKLYGQTPVHFAIMNNVKPAILLLLVQHNGSLYEKDKYNMRPLDYVKTPEMKETIAMLRTQREDAFLTPQKERTLSIAANVNPSYYSGYSAVKENEQALSIAGNINPSYYSGYSVKDGYTAGYTAGYVMGNNNLIHNHNPNYPTYSNTFIDSGAYIGMNQMNNNPTLNINDLKNDRTPTKTTTKIEVYKQLTIRTASEEKLVSGSGQEKEELSRTIESHFDALENIKIGSNNVAFDKMCKGSNHPFSPSDYGVTHTLGSEYGVTNTLHDAKFDSFITKDKFEILSKQNSPRGDKDGISEINPLDTLNSVCNRTLPNNNTSNNISPSPNIGARNENNQNFRKEDFSHMLYTVPTLQSKISEYENDDSMIKKENPAPHEENINNDSLEDDVYLPRSVSETDDLQYTPSKVSYIVSDLPGTSSMKGSNSKKRNTDQITIAPSNCKNSNYPTKKIGYHNKENSNPNNNVYLNSENNTNSQQIMNKRENLSVHNINNAGYPNKINLSPEYKRKLNFSNSQTNNLANVLVEEDFTYNPVEYQKINSKAYYGQGTHSTRSLSSNNMTEENQSKMRTKKKILNELNPQELNSTSNKTIIHYGQGESVNTTRALDTQYTCGNAKKMKKFSIISEYSGGVRRNSPNSAFKRIKRSPGNTHSSHTVYCLTESNTSAISKRNAKSLHEWLNKIGMQNYYNNFLESELYNIDKLVDAMSDIRTRITYKDFEEIGIRKPGHIYRMLVQLEVDAKMIDYNIVSMIFQKKNAMLTSSKEFRVSCNLKISSEKNACCNIFGAGKVDQVVDCGNRNSYNYELVTWLRSINLPHLRKNFMHNGFDSVEYLILQMFSLQSLDDASLEDCLHIYNKNERRMVLNQLAKEIKNINSKIYNNSNQNSYGAYFSSCGEIEMENEKIEGGCKLCIIF